jgi:hypothetical protein
VFRNYIGPKLETWIISMVAIAIISGMVRFDPGPRIIAWARCASQWWLTSGAELLGICYEIEREQIIEDRRARGPIEPKHTN